MKSTSKQEARRSSPLYAAFLVRCWHEDGRWRFLLENVATRERQVFEELQTMCLQLLEEVKEAGTGGAE